MRACWVKPSILGLVLCGASAGGVQAQYVSHFPTGERSTPAYRSAFPTEAQLAEQSRNMPYVPPHEAAAMAMQSPYIRQYPGMMPPGPGGMMPPAPGMMPGPGGMMPPGPGGVAPAGYGAPMPGYAHPGAMNSGGPEMMPAPGGEAVPAGPAYGSNPLVYDETGGAGGGGDCEGGCGIFGDLYGPYLNGCCGPRWYDVGVEYVNMQRSNTWSNQPFTSDGIPGNAPPFIVLSSSDLDMDRTSGVRVSLRHQIGAVTSIEGAYFGLFESNGFASVSSDTNNLFSVMSGFGNPPFFLGFTDTDRSNYQSISYESYMNSAELNLRRQWMCEGGRFQGTWLAGVRYIGLNEEFTYYTQSVLNGGQMDYGVDTSNDMIGFQIGGDGYICLLPGFMFGGEFKTGVYGNHAVQDTRIVATGLDLSESAVHDAGAFGGEAKLGFIWQVCAALSITGGYQVFGVDGVALAVENFNATPPFVNQPTRAASVHIDSDGSAFYHGFYGGVEYCW